MQRSKALFADCERCEAKRKVADATFENERNQRHQAQCVRYDFCGLLLINLLLLFGRIF